MRNPLFGRCLVLAVVLAGVATSVASETFVINSTSGDYDGACEQPPAGDCKLRDAIRALSVQSDAEPDVLSFAGLPGTGPWLIDLSSNITVQTTPGVLLDGFSAPGYSGSPLVEIRSNGALSIVTQGAAVRGLVLSNGLSVTANDTWLYANFVGTDQTGLLPGSASTGLSVIGANNIIGTNGDGAGDEQEFNVIRGSSLSLILNSSSLGPTSDNVIAGNLIGVDVTGLVGFESTTGILLNTQNVTGTRIGTNGDGIGDELEGNVIGGHAGDGIWSMGPESVIAGNAIGTDRSGCFAIPNGNGIRVSSNNSVTPNIGTLIGGALAVQRNIIATNTGAGVRLTGSVSSPGQVEIAENYLYRNAGLAIDMVSNQTPTPNDDQDGDAGINGLQNKPVLATTTFELAQTQVSGSLNSLPLAEYRIDFYASNTCKSLGSGEAQYYLGSTLVNTDDQGNASFDVSVDPTTEADAPFVTAIATDALGNSSEVSDCVTPMSNITFRDNFEGQCLDRFAAREGERSQIW